MRNFLILLLLCFFVVGCATSGTHHKQIHGIKVTVPFKPLGMGAVAIYPFVLIEKGMANNPNTINHENIHMAQYRELLIVGFPLVYWSLWITNYISTGSAWQSYLFNAMEQEAFENGWDFNYLDHRKPYAWVDYL